MGGHIWEDDKGQLVGQCVECLRILQVRARKKRQYVRDEATRRRVYTDERHPPLMIDHNEPERKEIVAPAWASDPGQPRREADRQRRRKNARDNTIP